jgi:hypothetical protein
MMACKPWLRLCACVGSSAADVVCDSPSKTSAVVPAIDTSMCSEQQASVDFQGCAAVLTPLLTCAVLRHGCRCLVVLTLLYPCSAE